LHVPPLQLPLIILLEQQRFNEPYDRGIVWEDSDDVGASLEFFAERRPRRELRQWEPSRAFKR